MDVPFSVTVVGNGHDQRPALGKAVTMGKIRARDENPSCRP
jgi:hypothetical protein